MVQRSFKNVSYKNTPEIRHFRDVYVYGIKTQMYLNAVKTRIPSHGCIIIYIYKYL